MNRNNKYLTIGTITSLFFAILLMVPLEQETSTTVVEMHPLYVAEFSDYRNLVGASHNIFVGKIISQIDTNERGFGPETQFQVEIIKNVKGNLGGSIIVNQQGGYKNGKLYVVEGKASKEYMLKPGSTYLLATRYDEAKNWHTLNPYPTATRLISNDQNLSANQLKSLQRTQWEVAPFEIGYRNEVLLDADVQSGKTFNSYKPQETQL